MSFSPEFFMPLNKKTYISISLMIIAGLALSPAAHAQAPILACVEFGPTAPLPTQPPKSPQSYLGHVMGQFHDAKRAYFTQPENPQSSAHLDLLNSKGARIARFAMSADHSEVLVLQSQVNFPKYQISSELGKQGTANYIGALYFTMNDRGDIASFALTFTAPNKDGECHLPQVIR
jgi:hypothetical protein